MDTVASMLHSQTTTHCASSDLFHGDTYLITAPVLDLGSPVLCCNEYVPWSLCIVLPLPRFFLPRPSYSCFGASSSAHFHSSLPTSLLQLHPKTPWFPCYSLCSCPNSLPSCLCCTLWHIAMQSFIRTPFPATFNLATHPPSSFSSLRITHILFFAYYSQAWIMDGIE